MSRKTARSLLRRTFHWSVGCRNITLELKKQQTFVHLMEYVVLRAGKPHSTTTFAIGSCPRKRLYMPKRTSNSTRLWPCFQAAASYCCGVVFLTVYCLTRMTRGDRYAAVYRKWTSACNAVLIIKSGNWNWASVGR